MTSTRVVTTRRRLFTGAAAALVAVVAAGCSGGGLDAGAAAIVGDRRVSVGDVQTATRQVNKIVSQDAQFDQRTVLSFLITGPYLVQEAAAKGAGVSDDDALNIFKQFKFTDPQTQATTPAQPSVDLVRGILALNLLQGRTLNEGDTPLAAADGQAAMQKVVADLKGTEIRVNPRFGTFDPVFDAQANKVFPITPSQENWLVRTPTPTPTGTAPAPTPTQ